MALEDELASAHETLQRSSSQVWVQCSSRGLPGLRSLVVRGRVGSQALCERLYAAAGLSLYPSLSLLSVFCLSPAHAHCLLPPHLCASQVAALEADAATFDARLADLVGQLEEVKRAKAASVQELGALSAEKQDVAAMLDTQYSLCKVRWCFAGSLLTLTLSLPRERKSADLVVYVWLVFLWRFVSCFLS